mmetsp:Transcript_59396/g.141586  ORF Transcript_59396/g.141586 Transcript_59396/m.141586 type:complete len:187 (-) Transcript_59396:124-684(-)
MTAAVSSMAPSQQRGFRYAAQGRRARFQRVALGSVIAAAYVFASPSSSFVSGVLPNRHRTEMSRRALVGEEEYSVVTEPNEYLRMGPPPGEGEAVYGLRQWLIHLGLEDHLEATNAWCTEMGAAVLEEVVEAADDLADALALPEEDDTRLRKRGQLAMSTLHQHGTLLSQSVLHDESLGDFAGRVF